MKSGLVPMLLGIGACMGGPHVEGAALEAKAWTGNARAWTGNAAIWTGNGQRWTGNAAAWTGTYAAWAGDPGWNLADYAPDQFLHRGSVFGFSIDPSRHNLAFDLTGLRLDPTVSLGMSPPVRLSDAAVYSPRLQHNGRILQVGDSIDVALLQRNADYVAVPVRATIVRTPDLRRRNSAGAPNGTVRWANYHVILRDVYPPGGTPGDGTSSGGFDWSHLQPCVGADPRCEPIGPGWGQYTTFVSMARPPISATGNVSFDDSVLQPVTLPGDATNVMPSLEGKAMFFGDFPVHSDLQIASTGGCSISSRDLAYTTGLAIGNAYWFDFDDGSAPDGYAFLTIDGQMISVSGYGPQGYDTRLSYGLGGTTYTLDSFVRDAGFESDANVGSFRVAMAGASDYPANKMVSLHVSDIGPNNVRELAYRDNGGALEAEIFDRWYQKACVDDQERLIDCTTGRAPAGIFERGVNRLTADLGSTCGSDTSKAQLSIVVSPVESCAGYAGPENGIGCLLDGYADTISTSEPWG